VQVQYKDYTFIDQKATRQLCDLIVVCQLVDDLMDTVIQDLSYNHELYFHILGVLEYYLSPLEYSEFMTYMSRNISEEILARVPPDTSTETSQ